MAELFTSRVFQMLALPVLSALLSVFVKVVSKNDQFGTFRKEDAAVGLEVALAAIITLLSYSIHLAKLSRGDRVAIRELERRMLEYPWILLGLVFSLWGVSTAVRKFGWKSQYEMVWVTGIVIPMAYGMASLFLVVAWIGS